MEPQDFIPNYPSSDDSQLQQKLMNKTEFSEIGQTNAKNVDPKYFDFQVNIARILSPYTPYNKVLLDLDIGVGKCVHPMTCVYFSNRNATTIQSMWDMYAGEWIDENWRLPTKDIFVLSYRDGEFCEKRITKFYREKMPEKMLLIKTANHAIIKTYAHRLLCSSSGGGIWKSNIQEGDTVMDKYGNYAVVQSVSTFEKDQEYVYDLEIEDTHVYVADGFVTHNTCSAILAHELAKLYYGGGFKKTVVVAKGPSLLENWKGKFLDVCPGERMKIIDSLEPGLDKKAIESNINEELKDNFVFKTVGAFSSQLSKLTDSYIAENYSNRYFVLDESQFLKNPKSPIYKQFDRLFSLTSNITVILMTGTPNTNLPWEGVAQINLLKPKDERLVLGPKFMKKYYSEKDGVFTVKNSDQLLEYYHGYTIHVRQTSDLPERTFVTNPDHPDDYLDETDVYRLEMSDFQSDIYIKSLTDVQQTFLKEKDGQKGKFNIREFKTRVVLDKDGNPVLDEDGNPKMEKIEYKSGEGGAFLRLVLESSLMVYPDGTYGGKGYKKNVFKNGKVEIPPDILKEFRNDLGKYSVIYKKIFDLLKNPQNSQKVFYIYFDNLNNSGLRLFAKLLEDLDGYKRTRGLSSCTKGKRYAVIDGSLKEKEIERVLKTVGMKENADGSCVRIVLGSEVTQTGLTIPHATIGIVVNAQFTPSSIDQITQRINRPGSLDAVIEAGLDTETDIYLMAPFAKKDKNPSAYMQVYKIAEEKRQMIRPQEELIKRAGLMCPVNYDRNVRSVEENYMCYSAKPTSTSGIYRYERKRQDTKTDYLYFQDGEIAEIVDKIVNDVGNIGVVDVKKYLSEYPKMLVYRACKEIATKRIVLERGEYKSLIFNKGDLYFVDPSVSGDPNSSFYFQTNFFSTGTSLKKLMNNKFFNKDVQKVEKLLEMENSDSMSKLFFSLSKGTQNVVFEDAYYAKSRDEDCPSLSIIANFKPVYEIEGELYNIVWAEPMAKDTQYGGGSIQIEDPSKIRVLKDLGWAWVPPRETVKTIDSNGNIAETVLPGYEDIVPKIKALGKKNLKKQELKGDFYATKAKSDGIFKIYLKGGRPGGRACANFSGKAYMEIYKRLGLFEKLYSTQIKRFKKENKGKIDEMLSKLLKTTKAKAIPDDFTQDERIGAYYALQEKDDQKCRILEKEFKSQNLFYEL